VAATLVETRWLKRRLTRLVAFDRIPLMKQTASLSHGARQCSAASPVRSLLFFAGLLAVLALASIPVMAHHGTAASYDANTFVTLKGTVTEFVWANPHSQVHWDVKGDDGKVVNWGGELHSIAQLIKNGWNKNLLKPGDEITVTGHASKAGAPYMVVTSLKLANGKEYYRDAPGAEQGN
jgi:hypothetical protein